MEPKNSIRFKKLGRRISNAASAVVSRSAVSEKEDQTELTTPEFLEPIPLERSKKMTSCPQKTVRFVGMQSTIFPSKARSKEANSEYSDSSSVFDDLFSSEDEGSSENEEEISIDSNEYNKCECFGVDILKKTVDAWEKIVDYIFDDKMVIDNENDSKSNSGISLTDFAKDDDTTDGERQTFLDTMNELCIQTHQQSYSTIGYNPIHKPMDEIKMNLSSANVPFDEIEDKIICSSNSAVSELTG